MHEHKSQASKHIHLSLYNISKASNNIDLNLYKKKRKSSTEQSWREFEHVGPTLLRSNFVQVYITSMKTEASTQFNFTTYNFQLANYYKHGHGSITWNFNKFLQELEFMKVSQVAGALGKIRSFIKTISFKCLQIITQTFSIVLTVEPKPALSFWAHCLISS